MILRLLLVVIVLISFGCAHVGGRGEELANNSLGKARVAEKSNEAVVDELLEPSELDAPLLFSLLGGEIAGQRGDINMASAFYADAAKYSRDPEVTLRAAQIALYNKDVVAAKSAVEILREDGRLSLQTYRLALTIYLRASDVPKSLVQIEELLKEIDIPTRNALLLVGDLVLRNASKVVAVDVMGNLVNKYANEAGVYLASSQIMSHVGEIDKAEKDARRAIALDSLWPPSYVQLALVLESKGDLKEALTVLKESSEKLQTRSLIMGYGQLLAKYEYYADAKEQFLNLVSKESDDPEAKFALGLIYLKLNDAVNAKEIFTSLYGSNAFSSKSAFYLGRINYHQKNDKEALVWFSKVGEGVNYIESRANMAMVKSRMGDLQGARVILQQLRNESPQNVTRFYLLEAELLMNDLKYQLTYQLLTKAVAEVPADSGLRYARSIAATEVGDIDMAESDLLFVLQKAPKDANVLNALGYTLASKTSRFKEARKYLTQALLLRPNDSAILDSMGWLNYREGAHQKALVLLESAYAKLPDGEIAAHLGEVLWVMGEQEKARIIWEQALEKDIKNRYLIEVMQRLK